MFRIDGVMCHDMCDEMICIQNGDALPKLRSCFAFYLYCFAC